MKLYRFFDNMSWPAPGSDLGDLSRIFTYGEPTRNDMLVAASVINAYAELIRCPRTKRDYVVRELRKGPSGEGK